MVVRIRPGDVRLYPGEPSKFITDPDGPVLRDLIRRMTRVGFHARLKVRRRTGYLLSTIRKQPGIRKTYVFVDLVAGRRGLRYTGVEEFGSQAHEIRARRRKALRFTVNGQVVFRSRVMHPGTEGSHFLMTSLPYAAS